MAVSSLILQAGAATTQTVGSYYAAKGERTALKLQARIAEVNAKIADGQARDALQRGERQEQASRLGAAQMRSTQRTGMAAGNIDLGSETAAAVLTSTDYLSEMDAAQIKANALRDAWGYRMEAVGQRGRAEMSRATARGISPLGDAASTLLTSAAQVGMSYASLRETDAFKTDVNRMRQSKSGLTRGLGDFFGRGL
jgi:hypothetical protein